MIFNIQKSSKFQENCDRHQFWSIVDAIDNGFTFVKSKDVSCSDMELIDEDEDYFEQSKFLSSGIVS